MGKPWDKVKKVAKGVSTGGFSELFDGKSKDVGRVALGVSTGGLSEIANGIANGSAENIYGKLTGTTAAKEQAAKARRDLESGKTEGIGYLDQSYNTQNALSQPVADLYQQYLPQLQQQMAAPNAAQGNINAMSGYQSPQLQSDFQLDYENDPLFIQQRDQMMKQLNRRMASQGGYASSDADNAMIRNLLPFMQDSYGRGVDTMNRRNQNALTTYGLDMDRQGTLYGMNNQQNQQQYDRLGNMMNLGLSGINQMSGNAQQYGQNRANIATGTANAMADNRYGLAQLGIATSPLNTLATIGSTGAKMYAAGGV